MQYTLRIFFLVCVFGFLCSADLSAQSVGTVKGTLTDLATKEALIGASVLLEGTSLGSATDVEGNFVISRVPAGTYTAVITYIGYKTTKVPNLVVEPGKITLLNSSIDPDDQKLEEVTVVGTRSTNTEVAVISEIREAQQVVSGISAEQIVKSQDRDAAEVVRRIPGVTVVDNRFINIRGLNERYNTVWLNDAVAPSSETDRKSFSFDIIPSNLLDRVLIFKTPSPELPGDFAGGMVKVYTRRPSYSERSLNVSFTEGVRIGTTFNGFTSDVKSSNDWLGFGAGSRKLPTVTPDVQGVIPTAQAQQFPNNYPLTSKTAIPDQRLNISYLTGFKIGEKAFGSLTALSYSNTFTTFNINRLFTFYKDEFNQDIQFTNNVRLGGLQNFVFSLNNGGKIEFRNMFNQISRNQVIQRATFDEQGINQTGYSYSMGYQSRQTYNGQLAGSHNINLKGGLSVEWVLGYAGSNKKEPDLRRTEYGASDNTVQLFRNTVDLSSGSRLYQELNEKIYSLNLGLKQKFNDKIELSGGLYIENKDRSFVAREFGYVFSPNSPTDNTIALPIDKIFDPKNLGSTGLGFQEDGNSIPPASAPGVKPNYSYDAANKLTAGYISGNFTLGKFKILGGVRFEHNVQSILAGLQGRKIDTALVTDKLLPSVNFSYNITEKSLIRAAYGRTLNRPEFREWAPFVYYDFDVNALTYGSLYLSTGVNGTPGLPLKVADIDNFDLRYEYYPSEGENIHVGIFYKNFTNPIEATVAPDYSNIAYTFKNASSAYAVGFEVDIRKKLNFFGSAFLNNFTVVFNGSLIKSQVKVTQDESWTPNRILQGQSPYVVNLGLYYQLNKWQVSGLYNVFGPRIVYIGRTTYSEVVEMPRHTIDLTVTRNLTNRLTINAGVSDLLNQRVLMLQDNPDNKNNKFERNSDPRFTDYRRGSYYTLGLRYNFF